MHVSFTSGYKTFMVVDASRPVNPDNVEGVLQELRGAGTRTFTYYKALSTDTRANILLKIC